MLGAQDGDHHTVVGAVRHIAFDKAGHLRGFYEQLVALDEGAFRQCGPAHAPQQALLLSPPRRQLAHAAPAWKGSLVVDRA